MGRIMWIVKRTQVLQYQHITQVRLFGMLADIKEKSNGNYSNIKETL